MSQQIVQRRLQIIIDESGAETALKRLTASADKLEKEIEQGTKAGKDMTAQLEKLSTTKGKVEELSNVVSGKFVPSTRQAQTAVTNLRRELDRMSADNPKYAATFEKYKQASTVFDEMKTKVTGFRQASESVFSKVSSIAAGVGLGNLVSSTVGRAVNFGREKLAELLSLSDELADIQKVSGLTASEVQKLNLELSKINTRTSVSELRNLAFALGQAGQEVTAANVQALDILNVALGDEFSGGAEEIGRVLQVLRNNLQDIKTENFSSDLTNIGNALNELGATGLATAPVVTDIANRIAGIAQTFGVTSGQILGIAGSFQELGISTERGSTAYTQLLQKMARDTDTFAEVAGVSVDEFKKLVNEDINEALLLVAKNSGEAAKSNTSFSKVLEELGTNGAGASELLSKLAANGDLVRQKISIATDALQTNSGVLAEFNVKNNTAAAQLEKFGKNFNRFINDPQLLSGLGKLVGKMNELIEPTKTATELFREQATTVENLDKKMPPLLKRYDELKSKTSLSKTEQEELNKTIQAIGETIPGTITQFDKYGRALDINREKAVEFIKLQKDILKERNRDSIRENEVLIRGLEKQAEAVQRVLNAGQTTEITDRKTGTISVKVLSDKDILENQKKLSDLQSRLSGIRGIVAELKGDTLQVPPPISPKEVKDVNDELDTTITKTTKLANNRKSELDKRQKELEALAKELTQIEEGLYQNTLEPYEKRLRQISLKFEQLFVKAGDDIEIRSRVLRSMLQEVGQLNREFNQAIEDSEFKSLVDQDNAEKKAAANAELAKALEIENNVRKQYLDDFAQARINVLTTSADFEASASLNSLKKRTDAQKEALEFEKAEAIKKAISQGESIAEVEEQYRQRGIELDKENLQAKLQIFTEYFDQVVQAFSAVSDILSAFEQGKINKITENYNNEKRELDKMLKQKLITEQDYYYRSQNLEEQTQRKKDQIAKREFSRNKAIQISQALIAGTMAVLNTLAAPPGPVDILTFGTVRAIQVGLIVATTAAQVAKLVAAKPPGFAKGGLLPRGSSHAEGGIGLVDNRTGARVGEIEGGEPIISRRVYQANKPVVDALLRKGWAQDSTPLPAWHTMPTMGMDISKINKLTRGGNGRNYFADGGVLPSATDAGFNPNDLILAQLAQMGEVNRALLERMNAPFFSNVIYGQYEAKGDAINSIRINGTIN